MTCVYTEKEQDQSTGENNRFIVTLGGVSSVRSADLFNYPVPPQIDLISGTSVCWLEA